MPKDRLYVWIVGHSDGDGALSIAGVFRTREAALAYITSEGWRFAHVQRWPVNDA